MGFNITKKEPAVSALPVHLENTISHHQYARTHATASTMSLLDHYFHRPCGTFTLEDTEHSFEELSYARYALPSHSLKQH